MQAKMEAGRRSVDAHEVVDVEDKGNQSLNIYKNESEDTKVVRCYFFCPITIWVNLKDFFKALKERQQQLQQMQDAARVTGGERNMCASRVAVQNCRFRWGFIQTTEELVLCSSPMCKK